MGNILIGTAGWSYDDWAGYVYPLDTPSRFDRLAYLAEMFDTLEVNSTFYRIPARRTTESWVRRTAELPNFAFSVKLYRGLTHDRIDGERDALMNEFLDAIEPIATADKLAAVLVQFPWSFRWNDENLGWIEMLTESLKPLPVAIEVRHRSWLNDEYLEYLESHRAAFCNIDQPQLNHCLPATEIGTPALAYVRLHGRNAKAWFAKDGDVNKRYDYLYNIDEVNEWAGRIRSLSAKSDRVLVYTNNHFCGQAVANALQLKSILMNRRIAVPVQLIHAFPQLKEIEEVTKQPTRPKKTRPGQTGWLFDQQE